VIGRCVDRAGNSSGRAVALLYDATPPPLADLRAAAGDRSVALSWQTSADAASVSVARAPGVGDEPTTVVFTGPGTSFLDGRVDNGVRYLYEVRLDDAAGNVHSETVAAVPTVPAPAVEAEALVLAAELGAGGTAAGGTGASGAGAVEKAGATPPTGPRGPHLVAPASGTLFRLGQAPLLRWTPVRDARYYNVQLFRDGHKVLSAWPSRASYRLRARWLYRGKRRRLVPGRYHWIVWPGYGPRSKTDYGKRLGRGTFEVRRAGS
jgi:hypothetical protein